MSVGVHRSVWMLGCLLLSSSVSSGGDAIPIVFARSGDAVTVQLKGDALPAAVVLNAFGRTLSSPSPVENGVAKITAPSVRVPVAFAVVSQNDAKRQVAQAVVYPQGKTEWESNSRIVALGAPAWFQQWCKATGVPVTPLDLEDGHWPKALDEPGARGLLVVGSPAAGRGLEDLLTEVAKHSWSVLILQADWIDANSGKVAAGPQQMRGALEPIRKEKWSSPLEFAAHSLPPPAICNRWPWIEDPEGIPLVERVCRASLPRSVVISYLPWEQQLGRRDVADLTLRKILLEADCQPQTASWCGLRMVHPDANAVTNEWCPVLAEAIAAGAKNPLPPGICVLDLRGGTSPPSQIRASLQAYEKAGTDMPLLIVGDDPVLDDWQWLKLDRAKKTAERSGVHWMPEDRLPSSPADQIRLMMKLTELHVPLGEPQQEKER